MALQAVFFEGEKLSELLLVESPSFFGFWLLQGGWGFDSGEMRENHCGGARI